MVLIPLISLLWSSFHPGWEIGESEGFSLYNYIEAYAKTHIGELLFMTLVFGVGSTILCISLAVPFAWLVERTDIPFKNILFTLMFAPVAIPGVIFSIGYIMLLSPKIGLINLFLMDLLHLESAPFNLYTLAGMIFVEGIRLTPGAFIMLAAAFKTMDPALEEASYTSGAGILSTFRRITSRLLMPAILAAALYYFVTAVESFEVPLLIGMPARVKVLTTEIYWVTHPAGTLPEYGIGCALGITFLLVSGLLIYLYRRSTRQVERFATITGKAYRPGLIKLGRGRYLAFAFIGAFLLVAILFPLLILIWSSLVPYLQVPSREALSTLSLEGYRLALGFSGLGKAAVNTLILAISAATITMILATIASWFIVRGRFRGAGMLDLISFLPHAIPSIVVALAIMVVFLRFRLIPIYGTVWILVVGFVIKRISYGTRIMNGAMFQLHKELEEAAEISGARWMKTLRRITLPLSIPSFINGWLFSALLSVSILTIPLMLHTAQNTVLAVVIWSMWDNAFIKEACSLSVLFIAGLFTLVFTMRLLASRARISRTQ